MSKLTVLSVDPGGVTGWLLFKPVEQLSIEVLRWGETPQAQVFCNLAWELNTSEELDYIVCEDFIPRKDKVLTWQPSALWIIGMLRWMITPERLFLQQPGDAMQWGTDTKTSPYTKGKGVGYRGAGHARMALKHALLWTATTWTGE